MKFKTAEAPTERIQRKHCPNCCFYLDGKKMVHDDGAPRFFFLAGMQFHYKSGSFYGEIGNVTPCSCSEGNAVGAAYSGKKVDPLDGNDSNEKLYGRDVAEKLEEKMSWTDL